MKVWVRTGRDFLKGFLYSNKFLILPVIHLMQDIQVAVEDVVGQGLGQEVTRPKNIEDNLQRNIERDLQTLTAVNGVP